MAVDPEYHLEALAPGVAAQGEGILQGGDAALEGRRPPLDRFQLGAESVLASWCERRIVERRATSPSTTASSRIVFRTIQMIS